MAALACTERPVSQTACLNGVLPLLLVWQRQLMCQAACLSLQTYGSCRQPCSLNAQLLFQTSVRLHLAACATTQPITYALVSVQIRL